MRELVARIRRDGRVLEGGFLKVDGFLNHGLDPTLTLAMGRALRERFEARGVGAVDRVVTAEVSGIAPGLATAAAFGVPLVYARKRRPVTMTEPVLEARAPSATKGGETALYVAGDVLRPGERVLLVDDFLASGRTIEALADLIAAAGAELVGIGAVIEKAHQHGRERLAGRGVPIEALARVMGLPEGRLDVREG